MDYHREKLSQRGRIVGMRESGLTPTQIARELGLSRTTVYLWLKRWEEEGNLKDKRRTGAPRKTTAAEDRHIVERVEANPFSNAVEVREQLQLEVSSMTVRRRLHESGIHHR